MRPSSRRCSVEETEPLRLRVRDDDGAGFVWLVPGLFLFLSFISAMAVYHSTGEEAIVAFVATAYLDMVLLFGCLWWYKRTAPGSVQRNRLKASVWLLTTLLTFSFVYMVKGNAGLSLSMALLLWAMAAATGIGAFSAFFEQARTNQQPDDDATSMV